MRLWNALSPAVLRKHRRTRRVSSWDRTGRNSDWWTLAPGETRVLADLRGPGQITHIWFAQPMHFREVLLRITWDDAPSPSVLCPVGDFFGLGNGFANSYQSALFSASTQHNNQMCYDENGRSRHVGTALNCYAPMPFRKRAVVELINESEEPHQKWFYIDYETFEDGWDDELGYFHAEFRRANPFGGWGGDLAINTAEVDIPCKERFAWTNNYVILETRGRGQYIGCNLSVANLCGGWWGEGDDMIWVDGYKWPPDLHGTGSEDYLGHAWGMQPNAFWRNGSSVFEGHTGGYRGAGGYQTSYVFHLENPIYFRREIKVTIEAGHGNHLRNDYSSTAYWYAAEPVPVKAPPPVRQRRPVLRDANGVWLIDPESQCPGPEVRLTHEILAASPAVAEALQPAKSVTLEVPRLPARLPLGSVRRALGAKKAQSIRANGRVLGRVRLGVSGDRLALVAEVRDRKPKRVEPNFWEGSAVELFVAPGANAMPGQVVFLPASGKRRGEARLYRQASRLVDAPGVEWEIRTMAGGYSLITLVPFAILGVEAGRGTFLVEVALTVPGAKGVVWRGGIASAATQAWNSARRFARATVSGSGA